MQATKDTFLKTLAGRLAKVNPARTVTIDGAARPAVLAMENETPMSAATELETFQLSWQGAVQAFAWMPLMQMECRVSYGCKGSDERMRVDRGRTLTAMDAELMQICSPRRAAKCDYTVTTPVALGENIFWSVPALGAVKETDGVLQRAAAVTVFFFPEVSR